MIFSKVLVRGFGQKFEIFPCFYFWQNQTQENVFDNILETKKAYLDSKIKTLKKLKNHGFGQRKGHD